jgi:hypothetical protein
MSAERARPDAVEQRFAEIGAVRRVGTFERPVVLSIFAMCDTLCRK